MLLSPPFLPTRAENQSEDDWLDAAMVGGTPGQGAYPVSFNLGWHGGLHLTAPVEAGVTLPVRAIAEGVVVYVRQPTAPNTDAAHALNYGDGWTSDGVVVIRHETEVGEGADAQVTFFSVYMHLSRVEPALAVNGPIYRKAELGDAGQIYGGTERKIHFELLCDDVQLRHLTGRSTGRLDTTRDGRLDAVFGDIYVKLPTGSRLYATQPKANVIQPTVAPVHTTTEDLFIGLRYGKGHLTVTTYREEGSTVGTECVEENAEYDLYKATKKIRDAYTSGTKPKRSALYELLRFGRIVHTASETLTPADVPHWRQVPYDGGQGWANLNGANTFRFSDADFPHWRGWTWVDDDSTGQDSRCDSATIRGWLDASAEGPTDLATRTARLSDPTVLLKLARTLCKLPTEWEAETIEARWGWLKTEAPENPTPLDAEDFAQLSGHISALCFWREASMKAGAATDAPALANTHWRFHPREFIRAFRKCVWMSATELARCIPRTSLPGTVTWAQASQRARSHAASINRLCRKYLGDDRQRQTHALAQVYIETSLLGTVTELGAGNSKPYAAFYGRGLMQLTWPRNYEAYGWYRGMTNQTGTAAYTDTRITTTSTHAWDDESAAQVWGPRYDPQVVATQSHHVAESGGYYWVSKTFRSTWNINRACDLGLNGNHVTFISWLVNGGGNGHDERQQYARYLANLLLDETPRSEIEHWTYPPMGETVYGTFPPGAPADTKTVEVNHAAQVP